MTDDRILDQLTSLFREVFDDDSIVLSPGTTADDIDGWDSQAHVSLIVAAEMRFGIRFRTAELESLHDVGELLRLIAQKTEAKP